MKRIYYLLAISALLLLNGCALKVKIKKEFYANKTKVGIVYIIDDIQLGRMGAQDVLDLALTQGNKYLEPLAIVDKKMDVLHTIKTFYPQVLNERGKQYVTLDYTLRPDKLALYKTKKVKGKKHYKYDLRFLKAQLQVDELLIVRVAYGLLINYSGFITFSRFGYCRIGSEIVNLHDNTLMYQGESYKHKQIKGKWRTPPEYLNIRTAIKTAIHKVLLNEKKRFNQ
ncbi:hypothetical protein [uncultured Microscilla sp.]|uniref:hypothetical protein n=1 Tax=uncultured Microscilla sp. TaxID=432653 RepID=UPI00262E8EA7|nr:hypothetical protein [uncultured Microscilla sp.]